MAQLAGGWAYDNATAPAHHACAETSGVHKRLAAIPGQVGSVDMAQELRAQTDSH